MDLSIFTGLSFCKAYMIYKNQMFLTWGLWMDFTVVLQAFLEIGFLHPFIYSIKIYWTPIMNQGLVLVAKQKNKKVFGLIQKYLRACFVPGSVQALGIEECIKQEKSLLWWNLYSSVEDRQ